MNKLNPAELRQRLDLEGKFVDFGLLRTSLSVLTILKDLETNLTDPTKEGECRAACPKCGKERSFALNVNTNRFNCFAKGCILKGGGVIDFAAKLWEVPAKEASHLLACAYGIQPYSQAEQVGEIPSNEISVSEKPMPAEPETEQSGQSREVVTRTQFEALESKVERLSHIVWSMMFEKGEVDETDRLFDEEDYLPDHERETVLSG
jgi:hypothetical protein